MHFELKAIITFFLATERAFLPGIIIIIIIAAKKAFFLS